MASASPATKSPMSKTKPRSSTQARTGLSLWPIGFLLSILAPVLVAVVLYQLESFEPAYFPIHELSRKPLYVPRRNSRILQGSEKIGFGQLLGPEDLAYDPKSNVMYTGCVDGWVKRVTVNESAADSVVENWVNTGGRPLGLVLGPQKEVIVADAYKALTLANIKCPPKSYEAIQGLLKVTEDGMIETLTDEAEGVGFGLTDGVDIAQDGMIYYTDASYKYSLKNFMWDFFEGRPHGRLMAYDPSTKHTQVLLKDLYFANGVAISPDQNFVIVCEALLRCKKCYIKGENKGSVSMFIDNLPGIPDNIRYDGEGHYWIAIATELTFGWDVALRYPFIRKLLGMMEKYVGRPHMEKNSGVLVVDLEGKPVAQYSDPGPAMVSTGIKIGDGLYCGSLIYPYIMRLNLSLYPAVATT